MDCAIYKGRRKHESYLYIESAGDFSRVPGALLHILGELQLVMELSLSPHRPLANADVNEVMRLLDEQGYYLQMPPEPHKTRH